MKISEIFGIVGVAEGSLLLMFVLWGGSRYNAIIPKTTLQAFSTIGFVVLMLFTLCFIVAVEREPKNKPEAQE